MKRAIIFIISAFIIFLSCEQPSENTTKSETTDENSYVQYFQSDNLPYTGYEGAFDTFIDQGNPTSIFGAENFLDAGYSTVSGHTYSLLKFNLTSIPSQATIKDAYLLLTDYNGKGSLFTVNIFEVINRNWIETSFIWNSWLPANFGSFMGSFQTSSLVLNYKYSAKLNSGIIKKWILNSADNDGLVMRASEDTYASSITTSFYSRETTVTYYRPMLVIYYTL